MAAPAPVTAPTKHTDYPYHPPRIDDVMYQAVVPPFAPPPPGDPRVGLSLPSVLWGCDSVRACEVAVADGWLGPDALLCLRLPTPRCFPSSAC